MLGSVPQASPTGRPSARACGSRPGARERGRAEKIRGFSGLGFLGLGLGFRVGIVLWLFPEQKGSLNASAALKSQDPRLPNLYSFLPFLPSFLPSFPPSFLPSFLSSFLPSSLLRTQHTEVGFPHPHRKRRYNFFNFRDTWREEGGGSEGKTPKRRPNKT